MGQWDSEKNYGRKAFATSRSNYVPPTTHLVYPNQEGRYITSTTEIHNQFRETWAKVYCKHPKQSSSWKNFEAKYGEHIPNVQYNDEPHTAKDLIDQLSRMKETVVGFDGCTKAALKLLPWKAWEYRAQIENMARETGKLLEAYLHAPLAMIPKGHALRPEQHRGITIFSMLHRLVYGVMWHRLKNWQEQWIEDTQQGDRLGGEYIADAWDLQIQIEEAQELRNTNRRCLA